MKMVCNHWEVPTEVGWGGLDDLEHLMEGIGGGLGTDKLMGEAALRHCTMLVPRVDLVLL